MFTLVFSCLQVNVTLFVEYDSFFLEKYQVIQKVGTTENPLAQTKCVVSLLYPILN